MADDIQLELQRKIETLERKNKLLEEGLRQAERLRQMFDRTAQELKATKSLLIRQGEELEEKVRERTQQLLTAQDELVRREKLALLGQVADTVGHELRNPLGVMNNAVYYLQAVLTNADETTREYLGIIKDEIGDAERIISGLLDAVRTIPPRPEAIDVAEVIGQTLRKFDIPASVIVKLDIPQTISAVRADPMHMHQVFRNLISNAVEAMPEGGTLDIRVDADEAQQALRISIRDSGTGMTSEQQARLFEPLFTTKARRIGLGLVVVKNLTEANGGRVEAESTPGKGSTFTIVLPSGSCVLAMQERVMPETNAEKAIPANSVLMNGNRRSQ